MNRPTALSDQIFDFSSSSTLNFQVDMTPSTSSQFYSYECIQEAGTAKDVFLNNAGAEFANGQILTNKFINRIITGPGAVYDIIHPIPFGTQGRFDYMIIPQAIAIIIDGTTLSPITPGTIYGNVPQNTTKVFNTANTRGANISKTLLVEITDTSNNYVTAVLNSDYQVITGSIVPNVSDSVSIKFLKTNVSYRLTLTATGYISSNAPYSITYDAGRSLVTQNISTISFLVNTYVSQNPITNTITFPQILCGVTPQYSLSTTPITTYQNGNITITGSLDLTTGSWVVADSSTQTSTPRTLTNDQWLTEINSRYNITLSIINKTTGGLQGTLQGLGPHSIILPQGDFLTQFNYVPL